MQPSMQPIVTLLLAGLRSAAALQPRQAGILAACPVTGTNINGGYDVASLYGVGENLSTKSYEFGTNSLALLELYNPELTVWDANPFPLGKIPSASSSSIRALSTAAKHIKLGADTLATDDDGHPADPATLGIPAILLGQSQKTYMDAAAKQVNHLLESVPRLYNGAISTDHELDEVWDEWIFRAPPFLAYYAVAINNASLLNFTIDQIGLYRDLLINTANDTHWWTHVDSLGPNDDIGFWAAGNGYAAAGMAQVLATVKHWGTSAGWTDQQTKLTGWIKEITDAVRVHGSRIGNSFSAAVVRLSQDDQGLITNYMNDDSGNAKNGGMFGEVTGTGLLATVFYRMLVLAPDQYGADDMAWADVSRQAIVNHVYTTANGSTPILSPAIDPYNSNDGAPDSSGSPAGQAFGVMLFVAYRDCVCAGRCPNKS